MLKILQNLRKLEDLCLTQYGVLQYSEDSMFMNGAYD